MGGRSADLIVVGRIATLAPTAPDGWGWVDGIGIRGGRVVAAGTANEVAGLRGPRTRTWAILPDQVVLPGLTDAHLHLGDAARAATELDLTGLDRRGVGDVIRMAHEGRAAAGDADGWLTGHGWSMDAIGRPDAATLDAVAPGRPIALWAHDHHARWLSGEALRRSGIGSLAAPPSGLIERDPAGAPTGLLLEGAAALVDAAIPRRSEDEEWSALAAYASTLHALGVTSVQDPGDMAPDPSLRAGPTWYRRLAVEGRLPIRVAASIRREQLPTAIQGGFRTGRPALRGGRDRGGEPFKVRYRDGWLKLFADGALGTRSASLLAPYETGDRLAPAGGPRGMALLDHDELRDLVATAAAAGIASQVHAIGDAAVRTALDVFSAAPTAGTARHRVEHAQLVDAADAPRFGAHGVAASVQACHLLSDAPAIRVAWGERAARSFPLADLDRGGALLALGTDAPVEPADPWPGIVAAVARRGPGWPADEALAPEQSIGLVRAIRAACLDGPRSLGIDDLGHLGPGAAADLIVVPAEPLHDPTGLAALAALRPIVTAMDGEVVHGSDPGD